MALLKREREARVVAQKSVVTANASDAAQKQREKKARAEAKVQRMLDEIEVEARQRRVSGPPQKAKPIEPTEEQIVGWIANGAKTPNPRY
jgi:Spy/CpxP family protein refolding chaperone